MFHSNETPAIGHEAGRSELFLFGLCAGIGLGVLFGATFLYAARNNDGFSQALGVGGLLLTLTIGTVQLWLAVKFFVISSSLQKEVDLRLRGIDTRIDAELDGFPDVFCDVVKILKRSTRQEGGELDLVLPLYDFGGLHPKTRDTEGYNDFHRCLNELIAGGSAIRLVGPDFVRDDPFGLHERMQALRSIAPKDMDVDITKMGLRELNRIEGIYSSAEGSLHNGERPFGRFRHFVFRESPAHLVSRKGAGEHQAAAFVVGAMNKVREFKKSIHPSRIQAADIDRFTQGISLTGNRGRLLLEGLVENLASKEGNDILEYVELRLMRCILADAQREVKSGVSFSQALLNMRELLRNAGELRRYEFACAGEIRERVYYWWRHDEARGTLFVIPSAAGLYSIWRGRANEYPRCRFGRYVDLCVALGDKLQMNVVLCSQGGQAGYGSWSPARARQEVKELLRDVIENYEGSVGKVFLFGICTGAISAAEVWLKEKETQTLKIELESVALWDLAESVGFDSRSRSRVAEEYNLCFAEDSEFVAPPKPIDLARKLSQSQANSKFWFGGVDETDKKLQEGGRRWHKLARVADELMNSSRIFRASDIGHVPGREVGLDAEFDKFLDSLRKWTDEHLETVRRDQNKTTPTCM